MLQRLIGVVVSALLTFLILWIINAVNPGDRLPWYLVAVVVGAITSFSWPVVIGFWLGRRGRARRDQQLQRQIDQQVAAKARHD